MGHKKVYDCLQIHLVLPRFSLSICRFIHVAICILLLFSLLCYLLKLMCGGEASNWHQDAQFAYHTLSFTLFLYLWERFSISPLFLSLTFEASSFSTFDFSDLRSETDRNLALSLYLSQFFSDSESVLCGSLSITFPLCGSKLMANYESLL